MRTTRFSVLLVVAALVGVPVLLLAQSRGSLSTQSGSNNFINGDAVGLVVSGLAPNDSVTLRAYRRFLLPVTREGKARSDTVLFSSTATVRADVHGRVVLHSTAPIAGTLRTIDPLGLFWSMQPLRDSSAGWRERIPARGTVDVVLLRNQRKLDSLVLRTIGPPSLREQVGWRASPALHPLRQL